MANRNFPNNKLYQFEIQPVLLNCRFIVDSTNTNGFGVRTLQGSGISRLYMHTTQTPAAGSPNPASGLILVQLEDMYAQVLQIGASFLSPSTGSNLTSTVSSVPNTISALGTTTLAQWRTAGLPVGITPAVGVSFIPLAGAAIGGTGTVILAGASGVDHIEACGLPNTSIISPVPLQVRQAAGSQVGGEIVLQALLNGTRTAPADGTTIQLSFLLSNSSVLLKGE